MKNINDEAVSKRNAKGSEGEEKKMICSEGKGSRKC
jgi:hypothetical protein